ncbi:hypothetical protein L2E82_27089 [Cichorium intybus]|uniref:Uncharacterized protein n=1 Tax=Cichorium intybus TaxID=13427 RepID=A0ACB9CRZ7_CICIN|nr:hypothetical protein L2E82_27089 [Cichorium intybus]
MEEIDIDEEEFGFSRNYFLAKESGKSGKKSARKLSEIDLVDEQDLRAEVSNIEPKHEEEIASLINSYKSLYNDWVFQLSCICGRWKNGGKPRINRAQLVCRLVYFSHNTGVFKKMEEIDIDEEEFGFSRNYFLAKESGKSGKKSARKLSEIDLVDEQDLRAEVSNIEPKHEEEIASLINSYKSLYNDWVFQLSCICGRWKNGGKPRINRAQLVCRLVYFSHNTGVFKKMEEIDIDEEEFGFSRNYFLAKESGKSGKKSARKLSEIDLVDEQDLRAEVSNIEPKHEEEIASLINSYKSLCICGRWKNGGKPRINRAQLVCRLVYFSHNTGVFNKMEEIDIDEEEFGFSRNYFLAKESGKSGKKSARKLSEIDLVDELDLRAEVSNIEPKHKEEIASLINSYKSLYNDWVFQLSCICGRWKNGGKPRINRAQLVCRLVYFSHNTGVFNKMEENDIDEEEFGFSRSYFLEKECGKSGKKSARKFSEIDLVDEQDLRAEVSNIEPKHEEEIASLINSYKSLYNDWVFQLSCICGRWKNGGKPRINRAQLVCRLVCSSHNTGVFNKMEEIDIDEEEFGFSRNYFLAKESGKSGKKSARKLSEIDLVDEQDLRAEVSNIEPKHEEEIASLINSYKSLYNDWVFQLSCICGRWKNGGKPRINRAQLVCRVVYFSHNTGVFNKMEEIDIDEEEFGFSRNYFLAKESGKSGKKSARKLSEIDLVDEQDLRAEVSNIEPKHEEEIAFLINSYKSLYNDWVFQLSCICGRWKNGGKPRINRAQLVCRVVYFSHNTGVFYKMEEIDIDEEEFGFSQNYFLAKESGKSGKKSARKLSEIDLVDEQDLRAEVSNIEPKHEEEIAYLINSYKSLYNDWVFQLSCICGRWKNGGKPRINRAQLVCRLVYFSHNTGVFNKMEEIDIDEEEFGFSRNYFLAKESGKSGKKSARKLSEIDLVDEQDLRAEVSNIEPKHEEEIASLINSYKSLYNDWVFQLSCICGRWKNGGKPRINRAQLVCRLVYFSHNTGVFNKMEEIDINEEEFGFSRNYFLAKECGKSGKKSARKLSEIDLVDEQDLRAEVSNIEPKHEEEIASLINSYKSLYNDWVFQLSCICGRWKNGGKPRINRAQLVCRPVYFSHNTGVFNKMEEIDIDEEEFGFSRNYFLAKESGKSGKKSARKLSEIDLVDEQDLRAEVSNIEPKHEEEIASLINSYKSLYNDWVFQLSCICGRWKNGGKPRINRAQLVCRLVYFSHNTGVFNKMEEIDIDEEEFGFSRNYFLAKESGKSGKKSARKLSEIDLVDERDLRAEVSNIEPKHEEEIASLINSYKSLYNDWVFQLRYVL